jgi:hypothetical protein
LADTPQTSVSLRELCFNALAALAQENQENQVRALSTNPSLTSFSFYFFPYLIDAHLLYARRRLLCLKA